MREAHNSKFKTQNSKLQLRCNSKFKIHNLHQNSLSISIDIPT